MSRLRAWIADPGGSPWTNAYGLARSVLALSTASTLLASTPETLLTLVVGVSEGRRCGGIVDTVSIFCIVPADRLEIARRIGAVVMLVVASGWRPRITGVLQWWIASSVMLSTTVQDNGDWLHAIIALLLVPWTLADRRRWHWQAPQPATADGWMTAAYVSWTLVRLQVAVVYLHSVISKLTVDRWADGTSFYYWIRDPLIGAPGWLFPALDPASRTPAVLVVTWGALVVEAVLAAGLFAPRRWWPWLFRLGVAFHAAIALVIGATSFSIVMVGALLLYLRRPDDPVGRPPLPRRAPKSDSPALGAGESRSAAQDGR